MCSALPRRLLTYKRRALSQRYSILTYAGTSLSLSQSPVTLSIRGARGEVPKLGLDYYRKNLGWAWITITFCAWYEVIHYQSYQSSRPLPTGVAPQIWCGSNKFHVQVVSRPDVERTVAQRLTNRRQQLQV